MQSGNSAEEDKGSHTQNQASNLAMDPITNTIRLEKYNVSIFQLTESVFEAMHKEFVAEPGDVLLASVMKTGTTWLMAILHSLMACVHRQPNLLDMCNPHDIVPGIEINQKAWDWEHVSSPRLLSTHLPFHALPADITCESDNLSANHVKIIYLTRNPRDTFISYKKFFEVVGKEVTRLPVSFPTEVTMEAMLDSYCAGRFHGGPFADNVLSYVRVSRRRPDKVLIVRYEDLQTDCSDVVRKIGEFLGYPSDVVCENADAIAERCSFKALTSAEFNQKKNSVTGYRPSNASYFRNGKSGEWKEYFTPAMEERIRADIEEKVEREGFYFNT